MSFSEGSQQAAQSNGAATKTPQSHKGQSEDSAMRRKEVKDGERKHAKMWQGILEASTRDKNLCAQLAKLSI